MLKKTSDAVKICMFFFSEFSLIFHGKSIQICAKDAENGCLRENRQRRFLQGAVFTPEIRSWSIFRVALGPRGPCRTSWGPTRSPSLFTMVFGSVKEPAWIGPGEAPGSSQTSFNGGRGGVITWPCHPPADRAFFKFAERLEFRCVPHRKC